MLNHKVYLKDRPHIKHVLVRHKSYPQAGRLIQQLIDLDDAVDSETFRLLRSFEHREVEGLDRLRAILGCAHWLRLGYKPGGRIVLSLHGDELILQTCKVHMELYYVERFADGESTVWQTECFFFPEIITAFEALLQRYHSPNPHAASGLGHADLY